MQLAALQVALLGHIQTQSSEPHPSTDDASDRLMSVEQAAETIGVDTRWLQRRYADLPFVRRLDARTIRVSEMALKRWMEKQGRR